MFKFCSENSVFQIITREIGYKGGIQNGCGSRGTFIFCPFFLFLTRFHQIARKNYYLFLIFRNQNFFINSEKPFPFKNGNDLRKSIKKIIQSKSSENIKTSNNVEFIEDEILLKEIDYYYTNPIARSSKVMSECRQISKKFLYTGIEKAI